MDGAIIGKLQASRTVARGPRISDVVGKAVAVAGQAPSAHSLRAGRFDDAFNPRSEHLNQPVSAARGRLHQAVGSTRQSSGSDQPREGYRLRGTTSPPSLISRSNSHGPKNALAINIGASCNAQGRIDLAVADYRSYRIDPSARLQAAPATRTNIVFA